MATQLENNTSTIETLIEAINALPEGITIDATLTQAGKAADAKAVGDTITSLTLPANKVTQGTFVGEIIANSSSQTPSTSLLRNSKLVSTETTPANNGEICWSYA